MPAIIALVMTYLPQIIQAGESLFAMVQSIRTAAQQTGEWTADNETQYQAALVTLGLASESQPDSPEIVAAIAAATAAQALALTAKQTAEQSQAVATAADAQAAADAATANAAQADADEKSAALEKIKSQPVAVNSDTPPMPPSLNVIR